MKTSVIKTANQVSAIAPNITADIRNGTKYLLCSIRLPPCELTQYLYKRFLVNALRRYIH